MSEFFRKISDSLRRLSGSRPKVTPAVERRRAPRFICSAAVLWEVGREQGEAQLREVSATGLRLFAPRAFLAGKHIRVRPLSTSDSAPLSTDVAIGTVVYSRPRSKGFEVGVELINPERISRFAWIGQLTRGSQPSDISLPRVKAQGSGAGLKLIPGGKDKLESENFLKPAD